MVADIYMATIYIGIELIGMRYTVISRVAMDFRIGLLLFFPTMKKYFTTNSRLIYVAGVLIIMTWSFLATRALQHVCTHLDFKEVQTRMEKNIK